MLLFVRLLLEQVLVVNASRELVETSQTDKHIHRKQIPVLGYDNKRVARPNCTSCGERGRLGDADLIRRPGHIAQSGEYKALAVLSWRREVSLLTLD